MADVDSEKLIALAIDLVERAAKENLVARLIGGVAVRMTCSSIETHPSLQRPVNDVDLVARRDDFGRLEQAYDPLGVRVTSKDPSKWEFDEGGIVVELTVPDFVLDHRIDLAPRLTLAIPTIPVTDLLLIKLQRANFAEKDIQDSIALLLDHRVAAGEDNQQINLEYIAGLCARDWGLFMAVYDNSVHLEQVLDKYVEPEEAQLVWRRIEQIQGAMDSAPKSLGWMTNQILRRPLRVAN